MKKPSGTTFALWLSRSMASVQDQDTGRWGISQKKLAEITGVPQSTFSEILRGNTIPVSKTLDVIADFFQIHYLVVYFLAYRAEEELPLETIDLLDRLGKALYKMPDKDLPNLLSRIAENFET